MTVTAKSLCRAVMTLSSSIVYTVPAATTTVITDIHVSNASPTSSVVELQVDGVDLIPGVTVAGRAYLALPMRQALAATKAITGYASPASVRLHINGVEIT